MLKRPIQGHKANREQYYKYKYGGLLTWAVMVLWLFFLFSYIMEKLEYY